MRSARQGARRVEELASLAGAVRVVPFARQVTAYFTAYLALCQSWATGGWTSRALVVKLKGGKPHHLPTFYQVPILIPPVSP